MQLFTVKTLAEHLELTPLYIRSLIATGKVRASKIGKSYYITEESVMDFLKAHEIKPREQQDTIIVVPVQKKAQ